jgi:hypothetical protein
VRSSCTLPQYSRRDNEVIRRFRDFDWLAGQLGRAHRGVIVPPLPDKSAVSKITGAGADFIEERRRGLQVGGGGRGVGGMFVGCGWGEGELGGLRSGGAGCRCGGVGGGRPVCGVGVDGCGCGGEG